MTNQYQLQEFDALARFSTISTTFEALSVVKKNNEIGTAQIVVPANQLIGIGYEILEDIKYKIDWTDYKNAIYVGGAAEGDDRLVVVVTDELAIASSKWGRSEQFESSQNSNDFEALTDMGRNFLGAYREETEFAGEIIDQPGSVYDENYFFGDVLSFSQPNISAVFNKPYIIQKLSRRGLGLLNNTLYFLKKIEIDNSDLTMTLIMHDAMCLLEQRIVAYPLGSPQSTKTMPADDMIKEVCRENLLATGREIANLSIDRNLSLAPEVSFDDFAWRSVFQVCQDIAEASFTKGVPLYFDILADINLGLQLKTFIGQRGQNRTGIVGLDSPYRAMINTVSLKVSSGNETRDIEFLQLNGEELRNKASSIKSREV